MKRVNGLYNKLVTFENLLSAFKKAYKGSNKSRDTLRFYCQREENILNLKEELINKTYNPGGYRYFRVYDPKERQIAVAPFRDRVIHHAVVNILEPIYEKSFIYDSYATRPEKGVHKAILRTQEFLRNNERYLRTDIKRYFDSVNHSTLLDILRRKIKDNDLLWLLEKIIKAVPEDKGIPIGNLREDWGQVLNYKFF